MKINVNVNGEAAHVTLTKAEWDEKVRHGYAAETPSGPLVMVRCPKTDATVLVPAIFCCKHGTPNGYVCEDCEAEYEDTYDCPIHGLQIGDCPRC